jgi:hypothetical protein
MAYIPTGEKVADMVRQAMRDRAPGLYRELKRSGALEEAIEERVRMFDEAISLAMNQTLTAVSRPVPPHMAEEQNQDAEARLRAMTEAALALALEFPREYD